MTAWVMEPMQEAGFSWVAYTASYGLVSVLVGILMAKLVEFPVLYLRDAWFPAKRLFLEKPLVVEKPLDKLGVSRKPATFEG
jgi:cbb3-type cytochrome oxidase subunit 1